MATTFNTSLPDIFPSGEIRVSDESHLYETSLDSDDNILEVREYTLDKAPISEIESVSGTSGSSSVTFEKGTDYELSADNNRIVWLDDPADRPDPGTTFAVTYRCDSIISRYVGSVESEYEITDERIDDVIDSKFVDQAEGDELDRIGTLFGVLGERGARGDEKYRNYLKAVVQAFSSRGKRSDIREAFSASLSGVTEDTRIDSDDIEIIEDFETTSYEVVLLDWTNHRLSTITEIAEIVDPSGVDLSTIRYDIEPDTAETSDEVLKPNITLLIGTEYGFWDTSNWDGTTWDTRYEERSTTEDTAERYETNITPATDYGDNYGDNYGGTLIQKSETTEATTSETETSTLQYERYDLDSWDNFSWDGTTAADESTGTSDAVETTVNTV